MQYDPETYFAVSQGATYLCHADTPLGGGDYDCLHYLGGPPGLAFSSPDLYCSGSRLRPDCSALWYPDRLARYDVEAISGETYVCKPAAGMSSSYGDKDCGRYSGGDPARLSTSYGLKCSSTMNGFECRPDYYPSEDRNVDYERIGSGTYVCKSTYQGKTCWRYLSGSPSAAMTGLPAYYCNSYGCSPSGYPSRRSG